MKFYFLKFICLFSVSVALSSCLNTDTTVTNSTVPRFSSLTLAGNDSITAAVFTVNADSVTIQNVDSLPFGTKINKALSTFTWTSTAGAVYYLSGSTTAKSLVSTDSIDYTSPVRVVNTAADGKTTREYTVKVNVHKVEPKLYVWSLLNSNIGTDNSIISQKAVYFNNQILYYANSGSAVSLYISTNGINWGASSVTGLPANATMENTVSFKGELFYAQDGVKIYHSSNGSDWSNYDYTPKDYTFKSLLFAFKDSIWAIAQSKTDSKYHFANSADGSTWLIRGVLPDNFPIMDFAATSFASRVGSKPKAIVIGGRRTADGERLNTNWNTEDGMYWINFNEFSGHSQSLDTLAMGTSIIAYDSKLFVFGTKKDSITVSQYKVSLDEGLTWKAPDTLYNRLPKTFTQRNYSSVVVDNSNRIYIIGGKTNTTTLTDVWTGKLNRLSFIRQ